MDRFLVVKDVKSNLGLELETVAKSPSPTPSNVHIPLEIARLICTHIDPVPLHLNPNEIVCNELFGVRLLSRALNTAGAEVLFQCKTISLASGHFTRQQVDSYHQYSSHLRQIKLRFECFRADHSPDVAVLSCRHKDHFRSSEMDHRSNQLRFRKELYDLSRLTLTLIPNVEELIVDYVCPYTACCCKSTLSAWLDTLSSLEDGWPKLKKVDIRSDTKNFSLIMRLTRRGLPAQLQDVSFNCYNDLSPMFHGIKTRKLLAILQKLTISNLRGRLDKPDKAPFFALNLRMPHLAELVLCYVNLTGAELRDVVKSSRRTLRRVTFVKLEHPLQPDWVYVLEQLAHCPSLVELTIAECMTEIRGHQELSTYEDTLLRIGQAHVSNTTFKELVFDAKVLLWWLKAVNGSLAQVEIIRVGIHSGSWAPKFQQLQKREALEILHFNCLYETYKLSRPADPIRFSIGSIHRLGELVRAVWSRHWGLSFGTTDDIRAIRKNIATLYPWDAVEAGVAELEDRYDWDYAQISTYETGLGGRPLVAWDDTPEFSNGDHRYRQTKLTEL